MAFQQSLIEKRKGWPHDRSWPQVGARVRYCGAGTNVTRGTYGSVKRCFEGDQVEVDFDDGTLLVCATSAIERAF